MASAADAADAPSNGQPDHPTPAAQPAPYDDVKTPEAAHTATADYSTPDTTRAMWGTPGAAETPAPTSTAVQVRQGANECLSQQPLAQSAPSDVHLQQLADAIAQRDALQQLLQQREGELLAAHEQASAAAAHAAQPLLEESQALRADNDALKQQLEDAEARASELDDANTRLEAQLAAMQGQAADAEHLQEQVRVAC